MAAAKGADQGVLGLDLVPQENNYYCAVATGVMVLGFHGIQKTQMEVANVMNPVPPQGCTIADQIKGYQELSKKHLPPVESLEAVNDGKPTSAKCWKEIYQQRMPFKSGVLGHARAVAGWHRLADGSTEQLVYDPWPPGIGQTYWENAWDALINYIYVRPKLYH
jgi:hypothetical protein